MNLCVLYIYNLQLQTIAPPNEFETDPEQVSPDDNIQMLLVSTFVPIGIIILVMLC